MKLIVSLIILSVLKLYIYKDLSFVNSKITLFVILGEAVYCDDMPSFENEAYMALVTSSRTHAEIISIDASEALKMEGVFDFISAKDIPQERNNYGSIVHDEEIFASEKVEFFRYFLK